MEKSFTKFMNWDEFEFVNNWNDLQPVISEIFKRWNDTAELLYEYHFIDIYNCVSVYEALPKVERCIDELNKRNWSVYGSIYKLSIPIVAKHRHLADLIATEKVVHHLLGDYVWVDQNGEHCSFERVVCSDGYSRYGSIIQTKDGKHIPVCGDTFEEIIAEVLGLPNTSVVNVESIEE
jgi:hypothetical protein